MRILPDLDFHARSRTPSASGRFSFGGWVLPPSRIRRIRIGALALTRRPTGRTLKSYICTRAAMLRRGGNHKERLQCLSLRSPSA